MISKKNKIIGYILLLTFDHWSKCTGQKYHPRIGKKNHPSHTRLVKSTCLKKLRVFFTPITLGFLLTRKLRLKNLEL